MHCGDLTGPPIVEACSRLPFYFVFGNHDADMASLLDDAATEFGANCLHWGGEISLAEKRIAVAHGHIPNDFRPLLAVNPDYFLFGHSHTTHDSMDGDLRPAIVAFAIQLRPSIRSFATKRFCIVSVAPTIVVVWIAYNKLLNFVSELWWMHL